MKQRSLLLITVDCLRADHVGYHGYDRATTPFIDSLSHKSFVFPRAIVAGAPTYFSFPAIMASRYPLGLGRDVLGIAPLEPTLASSLQHSGYSTAAFVAGNPYLTQRCGYDQGFATFRDFLTEGSFATDGSCDDGYLTSINQALHRASRSHAAAATAYDELYFRYCHWRASRHSQSLDQLRRYPAADVMVDRARSWLTCLRGQPFFLWLHLMDPHHPYYPPEKALSDLGCDRIDAQRAAYLNSFWTRSDVSRKRLLKVRSEIVALYDAGIYWVDQQICRLVTALKHLHLWDDTVLAITGDHGEEFLEGDDRYHAPTNLREQLIHVPLLVRVPGLAGVRLPDLPFSLIDLAPTLLQIMGTDIPVEFEGRGRWEQLGNGALGDEPAIVECVKDCTNPFRIEQRVKPRILAVRDSRFKLIVDFKQRKQSLFDLAEDPSESTPVPEGAYKAEQRRLLQIALEHLRAKKPEREESRLRARLRDIQEHFHADLDEREPAAAAAG